MLNLLFIVLNEFNVSILFEKITHWNNYKCLTKKVNLAQMFH